MLPSDPNHTPDPRPTGDLENLFRQKFAEAEVTPRASLWEQLDHGLLVQQNETYRRRLLGYRWAAAASVLLLAGGGTWLGLQPNPAGVAIAPVQPATPGAAGSASVSSAGPLAGAAGRTYVLAGRGKLGQAAASAAPKTAEAAGTGLLPTTAGAAAEVIGLLADVPLNSYAPTGYASVATAAAGNSVRTRSSRSLGLSSSRSNSVSGASFLGVALLPDGYTMASAPVRLASSLWNGSRFGNTLAAGNSATASRPELLTPVPAPPVLAVQLAPAASQESEGQPHPAKTRRWKLNAGYAASVFNPNIDFSRGRAAVVTYSNTLAFRSPDDTYETAATEYREKLQSGLGQQVSVLADYTLNDHWSVAAGVALAQQEATAATSWSFLDGNSAVATADAYDRSQPGGNLRPNPVLTVRNVRYRYRTASLPLNLRYTTGAKQGWALYAKLGAAVNVLLSSRTKLDGVPEATQTYTLTSADSPYRKVLASLHGGGGVRFRPANATWSLALGPKAETGLSTLNSGPSASLLQRRRPYAIGLEASMEFGGGKPLTVVP